MRVTPQPQRVSPRWGASLLSILVLGTTPGRDPQPLCPSPPLPVFLLGYFKASETPRNPNPLPGTSPGVWGGGGESSLETSWGSWRTWGLTGSNVSVGGAWGLLGFGEGGTVGGSAHIFPTLLPFATFQTREPEREFEDLSKGQTGALLLLTSPPGESLHLPSQHPSLLPSAWALSGSSRLAAGLLPVPLQPQEGCAERTWPHVRRCDVGGQLS